MRIPKNILISLAIISTLIFGVVFYIKLVLPSPAAKSLAVIKTNIINSVQPNNFKTAKQTKHYFAPILVFHHIAYPPAGADKNAVGLHVNPVEFETILKALQKNKYQIVFVSDMITYLAAGKKVPANWVALTFDDGYADFYTNAWPLLKKYNFKGSLYIITGYITDRPGANDYLSSGQLKELSQSDLIEIGSHSVSHPQLTKLLPAKLAAELKDSRQYLEKLLLKKVEIICYPYGNYNLAVEEAAKLAGYKYGLAYNREPLADSADLMAIDRASVWPGMKVIDFLKRINTLNK